MAELSLRFFGQFHVTRDERPITSFESNKVRALLAYLAVEAERAHTRSALTALLWPDYEESSARTNLRQALYQLRLVMGDGEGEANLFLINRQTLQFNRAMAVNCDVARFTALLTQCASHNHAHLEECATCLHALRQAVDLYQGEFLAGFTIDDSAPFEEWRRIKQEQFHLQALEALTTLADVDETNGVLERAQQYVRRQLFLEPWREAAHRQLMRLLARQGQRAAALAQYQGCRQVLAAELGVEPSVETVHLYEQIRLGKFTVQPSSPAGKNKTSLETTYSVAQPAALGAALPHNLPAASTPFVGRASELIDLLTQLQQPAHRLLTLVGPGGMGKTRLALAVAHKILDFSGSTLGALLTADDEVCATHNPQSASQNLKFADGIFFVSLAPLGSVDAVAPAIATAIDLDLQGAEPQQALLKFLRTKQMLLILDNFEHLLDAAGFVATLLQGAPQLQMIITSRARLNLHGEHVYQVQPLALGGADPLGNAAELDAVQLFAQSAQRIQSGFSLNATNLPAILRICQLVEGMPLGVEMAAAWSEWLSLAEIASEIEKSSDFLTAEWSDAPSRQRSLRAVFEWSWKLLNEHEQRAFRALSIFRGGFTRQAAEQVADASLRTLIGLVNKSLLAATAPQEGVIRYQIHELLRQFAAEQLNNLSAERAVIVARHSVYYLTYVGDRELRLARHEPRPATLEIQQELDNVRQAWLYAANGANCELLTKGLGGLARYYDAAGLLNESIQMLGQAATLLEVAVAQAASDQGTLLRAQPLLSKLLAIQSAALMKQGKFEDALKLAQKAATLGAACGGVEGEIYGRMVVAQGLYRKGQYAEGQVHFENLLNLIERHQLQKNGMELLNDAEYTAHVWLGGVKSELGYFAEAKMHFAEGIRLCQTLGKRRSETQARINLANLLRRMCDYPAARQMYEECLQLVRNLGYYWGEGEAQVELGDVLRLLGEYTLANDLCVRAEALLGKGGYTLEQLYSQLILARLHCYLGNDAAVRQWLAQFCNTTPSHESTWLKTVELKVRAIFARFTGDDEQARNAAQEAVHLSQLLHNPQFQAEGLLLLGHAQLHLEQWEAAEQSYQQADALYQQLENHAVAAEAQAGLALLALKKGKNEQALASVEPLWALLQREAIIGLDEPFWICLTCYQILTACQDARTDVVLSRSHQLLQHYLIHIHAETWQRSFLENVPVHRDLYQACLSKGLKPLLP
ncbi:MAG: BTAD domain-containing putative transcriptional regulator [Caldilineaceae bacterium]